MSIFHWNDESWKEVAFRDILVYVKRPSLNFVSSVISIRSGANKPKIIVAK